MTITKLLKGTLAIAVIGAVVLGTANLFSHEETKTPVQAQQTNEVSKVAVKDDINTLEKEYLNGLISMLNNPEVTEKISNDTIAQVMDVYAMLMASNNLDNVEEINALNVKYKKMYLKINDVKNFEVILLAHAKNIKA